jgi:hypothetical protein
MGCRCISALFGANSVSVMFSTTTTAMTIVGRDAGILSGRWLDTMKYYRLSGID